MSGTYEYDVPVWTVTYIGCIECGVENRDPVIGVYLTEEEALAKVGRIWRDDFNMANVLSADRRSIDTSESQVRLQRFDLRV